MNDRQIEEYILDVIKERSIAWLDMVSGRSISYEAGNERVYRINHFKSESWSERMIELICDGEYDPLSDDHTILIPYCELFRFWWNQIVDQQDMMDSILEDIFIYFKGRLQPVKEEPPTPGCKIDFSKLSIPVTKVASLSRK